jgi:hypothetical protein
VVLFESLSLIGSEPPSRMASQESMHQAPDSSLLQCYRGDVGCGVMSLRIHAGDASVESYYRWHCRVHAGDGAAEAMLVVALCLCQVML